MYLLGGAIKIGARHFLGRDVCFGDFKYQHWLPEIIYPTFLFSLSNEQHANDALLKKKNKKIYIYISGGPLSALTCCVNARLLSAIKKISPLIYSQSWVGSWVYTTQAMMTFTLIFLRGCIPSRIAL